MSPRQILRIVGDRFPTSFRSKLENYRYGPGAFKMDWALKGPVPWKAKQCLRSATVHLGGSLQEISASERAANQGEKSARPFVLVCQPTIFDKSRAPAERHTLWAYCHVPNDSEIDMTLAIENQIERFAPGFRDQILARNVLNPRQLEQHNQNLIGGDVNGGAQTISQMFTRPTIRMYSTPLSNIYLCSSSTPPGGGVHGLELFDQLVHISRVRVRRLVF